jgi:hypothetical protein
MAASDYHVAGVFEGYNYWKAYRTNREALLIIRKN